MQSIFIIMLLAMTPFLVSGLPSLKSLQESKKEFQAHGLALEMAAKTCIHFAVKEMSPLDELNEDQTRKCVGKLWTLMSKLYQDCSTYVDHDHEVNYGSGIAHLHLCALKTLEEKEPDLMDSFSIKGFLNLVDSLLEAFHERFAEKMVEMQKIVVGELLDSVIKELNEMVKECKKEEKTADAKFCEVLEKVKYSFAKHSQTASAWGITAKKSNIPSELINEKALRRLADLFSKKLN